MIHFLSPLVGNLSSRISIPRWAYPFPILRLPMGKSEEANLPSEEPLSVEMRIACVKHFSRLLEPLSEG